MSLVFVTLSLLSVVNVVLGAGFTGSLECAAIKTFTVTISTDAGTSKATIDFVGPSDGDYFAIALGTKNMVGAGHVLAVGSTNKFNLIGKTKQYGVDEIAWNNCKEVSNAVTNGKRMAQFTCDLTGSYAFPTAAGAIDVICTAGKASTTSTTVTGHASGEPNRLVKTITFAAKQAPATTMAATTMAKTTMAATTTKMASATTTMASGSTMKLMGSLECVVGSDKFTYTLNIDHTTKKATMMFSGSNTLDYFGVALAASKMSDGGWLLVTGSKMNFTFIGKTQTPSPAVKAMAWNNCKLVSNMNANMMRTTKFMCDTTGDYTLPTKAMTINYICTTGRTTPGSAIGYHTQGRYQKAQTLTIKEMSGATTTAAPMDNGSNKIVILSVFISFIVITLLL